MNQQMTLLLFGLCLGSCSQFPPRQYFYVNQPLNWTEAQRYCREHHTDLATFESMDDINSLKAPFSYSFAWIGLWDDPKAWKSAMGNGPNSWRWSATGETSKTGYKSWDPTNPDFYSADEMCVIMYNYGLWGDAICSLTYTFICYNVTDQNVKQFFYISTPTSWSSAQTYCRENYVDLAVIENQEENNKAKATIPNTDICWIGLYRVPWIWSDGNHNLFRHWTASGPTNSGGSRHCVTENNLHEWSDENCNTPHVFNCYQVVKKVTLVKVTTVTNANLSDPDVSAPLLQQLGAALTSQGWTDIKVRWKNIPKKKDNNESRTSV